MKYFYNSLMLLVLAVAPIACGGGGGSSSTITGPSTTVAAPTASPAGGSHVSSVSVTLSCAAGTARYTTDGSTPTVNSTGYSSALTFTSTTTLKAICVDSAGSTSSVMSESYTITSASTTTTTTTTSYTVTPSAGSGGTMSPSTAQTVNSGSTTSFTITPNSGYSISSVTGCSGTLSGNTYTTGAVTSNCTVTATFADTTAPGAPVITTNGGANLAQVGSAFTLNGTKDSDAASISVSGNVSGLTITYPTATTWQVTGTLGGSSGADITISVTASDSAGNTSSADTIIISWL